MVRTVSISPLSTNTFSFSTSPFIQHWLRILSPNSFHKLHNEKAGVACNLFSRTALLLRQGVQRIPFCSSAVAV